MNPNGGVDASVNRPFIRFSYPGYLLQGIRSENISMHGGIEARGTTLPPHSPLAPSFVSFPSYTTWRMHIPPVPLASPTLFTKRNPRMTESRRASWSIDPPPQTFLLRSKRIFVRLGDVVAMTVSSSRSSSSSQSFKISLLLHLMERFSFFFFYLATLSSNKEGRKRG